MKKKMLREHREKVPSLTRPTMLLPTLFHPATFPHPPVEHLPVKLPIGIGLHLGSAFGVAAGRGFAGLESEVYTEREGDVIMSSNAS